MAPWPEGVRRIVFADVDSTNRQAMREIAAGAAAPAWILAHRQTAGRGRRGRPWTADVGNFTASLMYRPDLPLERFAETSFVAALALKEVVEACAPNAEASLKWPNDVLLKTKEGVPAKLSGILLETSGPWLIVGIGVNLASAPPPDQLEAGALPSIALSNVSEPPTTAETFLDRLAPSFDRISKAHQAGGFRPIRAAWLEVAHGLGARLVARTGKNTHSGVFEDIDETGALILTTANGRLALPAADVYFEPS